MIPRSKLIDVIERSAKQAAERDRYEEIDCGEIHSAYFKKYYDIHMKYLNQVSEIKPLNPND